MQYIATPVIHAAISRTGGRSASFVAVVDKSQAAPLCAELQTESLATDLHVREMRWHEGAKALKLLGRQRRAAYQQGAGGLLGKIIGISIQRDMNLTIAAPVGARELLAKLKAAIGRAHKLIELVIPFGDRDFLEVRADTDPPFGTSGPGASVSQPEIAQEPIALVEPLMLPAAPAMVRYRTSVRGEVMHRHRFQLVS